MIAEVVKFGFRLNVPPRTGFLRTEFASFHVMNSPCVLTQPKSFATGGSSV